MSVIGNAVEGAVRGALGYFFDPKEAPYDLPVMKTELLSTRSIYNLLRETFENHKSINAVSYAENIQLVSKETRRRIGWVTKSNYGSTNSVSRSVDELHRRCRTMLWNTEQRLPVESTTRKVFGDFLEVVDTLTKNGESRIHHVNVNQVAGLTRATVTLLSGGLDQSRFFEVSFIFDGLHYDFKIPGRTEKLTGHRYNVLYDPDGRLAYLEVVHKSNLGQALMRVVATHYSEPSTFRANGTDPLDTLIPVECITALDLQSVHGHTESISAGQHTTEHEYNCHDVKGRPVVVTVYY